MMNGKKDLLNDDCWDREIDEFLASYTVKTIDEEEIGRTVDVLRTYMPKAKDKYKVFRLIQNEITYVNKIYWVISMIIMILGIIITNQQSYSSYETLLFISPIPIILGIYEIERGKREKMWELEKSFKYSYSKIMITRLLIIISFTAIVNMTYSLFLYNGQGADVLIRFMTAWIAPIFIVILINIIVVNRFSSSYSIIITSSIWIVTLVLGREKIISFIEDAQTISLIITILISIVIFSFAILKFYNYEEKYEGELLWS